MIHVGDCREVMAGMEPESVDAIVCDPPYGLNFMGKEWDNPAMLGQITGGPRTSKGPLPIGKGTNSRGYADNDNRAFQAWCETWAVEAWRVLKPGGHLLAFGGTRTFHRLTVAIEDAGFEIRDCLSWLYGSGFPKSLDVSKAIDKANGRRFDDRYALGRHIRERREALGISRADVNAWFGYVDGCEHWERQDPHGARVPTLADWRILSVRLGLSAEWLPLIERTEAEREVIGERRQRANSPESLVPMNASIGDVETITAPATPEAEQWAGWGTALKPAWEPVIVSRKPIQGTVAANVLQHGTGALNIDGCRIEGGERPNVISARRSGANGTYGDGLGGSRQIEPTTLGRWPANVVLSHHEDCTLVGTKRVKGTNVPGSNGQNGKRQSGFAMGPDSINHYADPDGMETVEAWDCHPDCPVRMLDQMTGERGNNWRANKGAGLGYHGGDGERGAAGHGDTGGCSRFFKVVQYDLNSEAVEGIQWDDQGHRLGIQAESDTPPQRDTTDSTCGMLKPSAGEPSLPMSLSGNHITDQSPRDSKFTTETATSRITTSATSSSLTPSPTSDCTAGASCEAALGTSLAESVASSSPSTPITGTSPERDGRSTDDAGLVISEKSLPISKGGVRFAYVPKASRRERNAGLDTPSIHPTVKPIALMRWLVRLVTPPGGLILDPFAGSGSTGCAAVLEGLDFIGIEADAEYAAIAERRIAYWASQRPTVLQPALPLEGAAD